MGKVLGPFRGRLGGSRGACRGALGGRFVGLGARFDVSLGAFTGFQIAECVGACRRLQLIHFLEGSMHVRAMRRH